jgi:hypothetical protein
VEIAIADYDGASARKLARSYAGRGVKALPVAQRPTMTRR